MNIISLGPAYPYRGGLASFNDRLAQQFVNEGHNIEVVTFRLQYPRFLFPGKTQYTDGPAPQGIKISRKLNSINPFNWITYRPENQESQARHSFDSLLAAFYGTMSGDCGKDCQTKQAYCCNMHF
jgi:hypothetical protein